VLSAGFFPGYISRRSIRLAASRASFWKTPRGLRAVGVLDVNGTVGRGILISARGSPSIGAGGSKAAVSIRKYSFTFFLQNLFFTVEEFSNVSLANSVELISLIDYHIVFFSRSNFKFLIRVQRRTELSSCYD
jgi:hypothetical protein